MHSASVSQPLRYSYSGFRFSGAGRLQAVVLVDPASRPATSRAASRPAAFRALSAAPVAARGGHKMLRLAGHPAQRLVPPHHRQCFLQTQQEKRKRGVARGARALRDVGEAATNARQPRACGGSNAESRLASCA
jgi:hypothetical protein